MKSPIDAIRLTANERDLLVRIKKYTGIPGYNVICRWCLLAGLRERIAPVENTEKRDALEIRWDTFAGGYSDVLIAVVVNSYHRFRGAGGKATLSSFISTALASGLKQAAHSTRGGGIQAFARLK